MVSAQRVLVSAGRTSEPASGSEPHVPLVHLKPSPGAQRRCVRSLAPRLRDHAGLSAAASLLSMRTCCQSFLLVPGSLVPWRLKSLLSLHAGPVGRALPHHQADPRRAASPEFCLEPASPPTKAPWSLLSAKLGPRCRLHRVARMRQGEGGAVGCGACCVWASPEAPA